MKILGFNITRAGNKLVVAKAAGDSAVPVSESRNVWTRIYESYTGAWQHNVTVDIETVKTFHVVFACMTLIASDIAKLGGPRLMALMESKIWEVTANSAYDPVLRRPNSYQNRIQFWESWILSKLSNGNTYVLLERDGAGKARAMYILDPSRVTPMVTPSGVVFYKLAADNLSGIAKEVMVPASEIIHDRFNCLYHPLVGLSPLIACGVAATQGMAIQNNQTHFFNNRSLPSGFLTAPGNISDESATALKTTWASAYSGENAGKVAVMGDGLEFKTIAFTSVEAQVLEQLKWTAEVACSVFHVPGYKVGVGVMPAGSSVQSLNLEYYTQALQHLIEAAELAMDDGLGLDEKLGTEFDLDKLLRMDSVSMATVEKELVDASIKAPNEARKRFNLKPLPGGDALYKQQQNYSLEALAKRDARPDPFKTNATPAATPAVPGAQMDGAEGDPPPVPAAANDKSFDLTRDPQAIAKALQSALAA